ncbi:MAG TPA: hypothetical protein VMG35_26880, partial [Bryobacteraceae bacterium]|nr:hypothetical protein [Bryobacteraceae bacterium]
RWYQPWSLDLLRDTPFNCVIVTWAGDNAGAGLEREQHRIVREYAAQAHQRGIAVMGAVPSAAALSRTAADAMDAGLDGLVLENGGAETGQAAAAKLPVVVLPKAATAPGVRLFSEGGAVQATPTSEPWLDSNLWLVSLLKARGAGPAWLGYKLEASSASDYTRAIADAAAAGGHWVVAPDDALLTGLASGAPQAKTQWRQIATAAQFFEKHTDWRRFQPAGPLGILQPANDAGDENLNLIARRRIPYRLLDRAALIGPDLAGFSAVLALGCALSDGEKAALTRFAQKGGLAIVGPDWGGTVPKEKDFEVRPTGEGRIAVYRDEEPDPEALSKDVLYLMGKDHLGIRLFHAVTVLPVVREDPGGRQLLIQLVNYASLPAETVTLRLAGDYRRARLYGLDGAPVELELEKSDHVTQLKLATVPVYSAVVLER